MTDVLVALPIALPLTLAAVMLVLWRDPAVQRVLAVAGLTLLLVVAVLLLGQVIEHGPLILELGGWPAPLGITFRADLLGAILTLVAALVGAATAVYALHEVPDVEARRGFWPLLVLLVMAVCGSFLTADIFNLFVWFEVMLIASFVLLALGRDPQQLAGAHIYLVLNLIGSTIFLISIGVIYGTTHTLDFAQLSVRSRQLADVQPGLTTAVHVMLLVAFGLKAAVMPLMFWLPASYHTPAPWCRRCSPRCSRRSASTR